MNCKVYYDDNDWKCETHLQLKTSCLCEERNLALAARDNSEMQLKYAQDERDRLRAKTFENEAKSQENFAHEVSLMDEILAACPETGIASTLSMSIRILIQKYKESKADKSNDQPAT